MVDHLGDAVHSMVSGQVCWLIDADFLAGRESMHEGRALIEFLVGRRPDRSGRIRKDGDVWPTDYVPDWEVDPEDVRILRAQIPMLDKRLAHLSLARADVPDDPPETWNDAVRRIFGLFKRFVAALPDEAVRRQLERAPIANAEAELRRTRPRR
jgi:hypothetical protein